MYGIELYIIQNYGFFLDHLVRLTKSLLSKVVWPILHA
jgi:hypothetical protein